MKLHGDPLDRKRAMQEKFKQQKAIRLQNGDEENFVPLDKLGIKVHAQAYDLYRVSRGGAMND